MITLVSISAFSQENGALSKSLWNDPINHPMMPMYLVSVFVFSVAILVAFVAIYMIRTLNMMTAQMEQGHAQKQGLHKPGWWSRFIETMNAAVPVEKEKNIELDHNYDGIKELDNHLPPWWKWLFVGTIVWSAVYLFVFHVSNSLPLSLDEYQHEVALAEEHARLVKLSQPHADIDETKLVFAEDSTSFISNGKTVFIVNNCGSCHRTDGGGNTIGPNLTDDFWIHGGHIKNVFTTIKDGVVEKGMPAWGKSLSPQQVRDVTFFVMSLKGSNPLNAKAPQGNLYKNEVVVPDSAKVQASL
jgi:cytochrome c oxidase cbb3-type subunit 3